VSSAEPGYRAVVAAKNAVLALRADQRVFAYTPRGEPLAELRPDPGQRIVEVTERSGRVLVAIEDSVKSVRRARWINVDAMPTWGAWLRDGIRIGQHVAISPRGQRIASAVGEQPSQRMLVVDPISEQVVLDEPAGAVDHVAFVDDDTLLVMVGQVPRLLSIAKRASASMTLPSHNARAAVGGEVVVTAQGGHLITVTNQATHYLGYAITNVHRMAADGEGGIALAVDGRVALVDRELHERDVGRIELANNRQVTALRWLTGRRWLVATTNGADGQLALHDFDTGQSTEVASWSDPIVSLQYEPTTRVLAVLRLPGTDLFRFDGKVALQRMPNQAATIRGHHLYPLDPAVASGTVAVAATPTGELRWLADVGALARAPAAARRGMLAGLTTAGIALVLPSTEPALIVLDRGREVGKLPPAMPLTVAAHGVARTEGSAVSLIGLDGKELWSRSLRGIHSGLWLSDGSLAFAALGVVYRVDGARGTTLASRCGFAFVRSTKRLPVVTLGVGSPCAQPTL
jgi:hypothetical protein